MADIKTEAFKSAAKAAKEKLGDKANEKVRETGAAAQRAREAAQNRAANAKSKKEMPKEAPEAQKVRFEEQMSGEGRDYLKLAGDFIQQNRMSRFGPLGRGPMMFNPLFSAAASGAMDTVLRDVNISNKQFNQFALGASMLTLSKGINARSIVNAIGVYTMINSLRDQVVKDFVPEDQMALVEELSTGVDEHIADTAKTNPEEAKKMREHFEKGKTTEAQVPMDLDTIATLRISAITSFLEHGAKVNKDINMNLDSYVVNGKYDTEAMDATVKQYETNMRNACETYRALDMELSKRGSQCGFSEKTVRQRMLDMIVENDNTKSLLSKQNLPVLENMFGYKAFNALNGTPLDNVYKTSQQVNVKIKNFEFVDQPTYEKAEDVPNVWHENVEDAEFVEEKGMEL